MLFHQLLKNVAKKTPNCSENTTFNFKALNLCELVDLSLFISKIKFYGGGHAIF